MRRPNRFGQKYGKDRADHTPARKAIPPAPTPENVAKALTALEMTAPGYGPPRPGLAPVRGNVRDVTLRHQPVENPTMPTLAADNWTQQQITPWDKVNPYATRQGVFERIVAALLGRK